MTEDWLKKRLSPVKDQQARWIGLSEAVQTLWESEFDPAFNTLSNIRSAYTASPEDLKRRIRELGDFFQPDMPTQYDQPLSLAWKKSELQGKDTEFIIQSVLRRNFSNLSVEWIPVYADTSKPYGEGFVPEPDLQDYEKELFYFLTSRGMMSTDLGYINSIGMTKADFLNAAEPLIYKYKPEHIVYFGPMFYINLPINCPVFPATCTCSSERDHVIYLDFAARFDFIAADARWLDNFYAPAAIEVISEPALHFVPDWFTTHLDAYVCGDGIPCDWMPLDTLHPASIEAQTFPTLDLPFSEKVKNTAPAVWGGGLAQ